jgi:ABC-type lipoprotein export system ATPase subunit
VVVAVAAAGLSVDAADHGAACLVATHSTEALSYADRVIVIRGGRLAKG